jgi:RND family efflux transporter MFP subunit
MLGICVRIILITVVCSIFVMNPDLLTAEDNSPTSFPLARESHIPLPDLPMPAYPSTPRDVVEAVIINPYRSANVGTDVSGIVEAAYYEEGDFVPEGQVVIEISKTRYALQFEKAREAVRNFRAALAHAERQAKIMKDLLGRDATTHQEVLKAESERDMAAGRLQQAIKDAQLAELSLRDCQVRAPFSGYVAFRYKQPYEPVERLEKIFTIVDTARVYALANVPEDRLSEFGKGAHAVFSDSSGKRYTGTVHKIGKVIDVKSKTKRVYVMLDNSLGELEVGMTGSVKPDRSDAE